MNTETHEQYRFENLSLGSRTARFILATIFIAITLSASGAIGVLVALPLASVYLVATGLTGWGPVKELFHHQQQGAKKLSPLLRTGYAVLATVLIGSVMATAVAPLGWLSILPLLAVYPAFGAITGVDLFDAWNNNGLLQDDEAHEKQAQHAEQPFAEIYSFADTLLVKLTHKKPADDHHKAA